MLKKLLVSVALVVVLASISVGTVFAYTISPALVTGQNDIAGYVKISNDADFLYVKYWMKAGYCVTETQVDVEIDPSLIPQNKGGAIPGKFDYKTDHPECATFFEYKISLDDEGVGIGDVVYIAAHAVVVYPDGTEETGWAVRCSGLWENPFYDPQFPGDNWSAFSEYELH